MMDFDKNAYKLTLYDLDQEPSDIAKCYMPTTSSEIFIGVNDADTQHGVQWEEMGKKKEQNRQDAGVGRYKWTTTSCRGQKTAHLVWVQKISQTSKKRNYILLDEDNSQVVAEFKPDESLYMGGILEINKICGHGCEDIDFKVLMAFLAIYEARRRRSHHTVYRPSKGEKAHLLFYRALQFLVRFGLVKS